MSILPDDPDVRAQPCRNSRPHSPHYHRWANWELVICPGLLARYRDAFTPELVDADDGCYDTADDQRVAIVAEIDAIRVELELLRARIRADFNRLASLRDRCATTGLIDPEGDTRP